jgi:hypothetical protein
MNCVTGRLFERQSAPHVGCRIEGKFAAFGVDSAYRSGAPRSMKMGTTFSLCRYDAAARHALQSAKP